MTAMPPVMSLPPAGPVRTLLEDVAEGLLSVPRSLPPKYFYDAHGSDLFDRICDTPEYYPTRAEADLLAQIADNLLAKVAPDELIELGSGTSRKTRILFDACARRGITPRYVPLDVCDEMLARVAGELNEEYAWLEVQPVAADYTQGLDHLPRAEGARLWAFLGGTIGNFEHAAAVDMLREVRLHLGPDDRLLIGADRLKAPERLHAAYNDAAGVTAEFNLNMITVLNRELGTQIPTEAFHHHACFNPARARIEMYLVANTDLEVPLAALGETLSIREGEAILTEISRKFTRRSLETLLEDAGYFIDAHFELEHTRFSLLLAGSRAV